MLRLRNCYLRHSMGICNNYTHVKQWKVYICVALKNEIINEILKQWNTKNRPKQLETCTGPTLPSF